MPIVDSFEFGTNTNAVYHKAHKENTMQRALRITEQKANSICILSGLCV
jgi:hypothetical protein